MPTSWKRSPEELHRVYIENTEAFYRVAGRAAARELDGFMQSCALALWARAGSVTQAQVDAINQLYSKGRSKGTRLLWELTGEVCRSGEVLPAQCSSGAWQSGTRARGGTAPASSSAW